MRIIGGRARGLHLAPVGDGDAAAHLRPTSDRVREAIFNLLINGKVAQTGDPVTGARVLDLFAGTGALGLEALSRGAAFACFVDDGKVARNLIKRNIALMRVETEAAILPVNATALIANREAGFDLVFLDPPYGKSLGQAAIASCLAGKWLAPNALIVWEEASVLAAPQGFTLVDQRKYGETFVTMMRVSQ